jgi:acetylornithine deacetylase
VPITGQAWTDDPFHLTQKENKLYGRGTADMKGFLALILSRVPKMISANL